MTIQLSALKDDRQIRGVLRHRQSLGQEQKDQKGAETSQISILALPGSSWSGVPLEDIHLPSLEVSDGPLPHLTRTLNLHPATVERLSSPRTEGH